MFFYLFIYFLLQLSKHVTDCFITYMVLLFFILQLYKHLTDCTFFFFFTEIMFSGFFFSKLFYKQSTFVLKEQMFVGDALHSFSQHSPRYTAMGCGGWEGNFLITASSKDKTFCV